MNDPRVPSSPFPPRRQVHRHDEHVFADDGGQWEEPTAPTHAEGIPLSTGGQVPHPSQEAGGGRGTPAAPTVGFSAPAAEELFRPLLTGEGSSGLRSRRLEHERARARRRRRNRRIRTFVVLVVVLGLLAAAGYYAFTQVRGSGTVQESDDYPGPGTGTVEVTVEQGDVGAVIGQRLVDQGVVKTVGAFTRAFDANKASASIKPGTYTLRHQMAASDAVAALLDDSNRSDNTVTVTPGQTAAQVAAKISQITGVPEDDVTAALKDGDAIGLPKEAGGHVEGWLAPGSYEVSSTDTPTTLLTEMVRARVTELDGLGVAESDRQDVLIKASILEREMNIPQYLPKAARVIENRLDDPDAETKGYLQMDSTVLYGVGKTGGLPTDADMADDNPFNTYLHRGLPPTPISQPGTDAIKATLDPAEGSWLYFVTVNLDTGETLFADTLAQHDAYQKQLQQWCAANKGKC